VKDIIFIISAWLGSVTIGYFCNYTSRESNGPMGKFYLVLTWMAGRDQTWDMQLTGKRAQTYGRDYSFSFLLQLFPMTCKATNFAIISRPLRFFTIAAIRFWARLCAIENGKTHLDRLQRARLDRPATPLSYTGTCQCKRPYRLCAYFLS